MKKIIASLIVFTLMISLTGCGTMGSFRANNVTNVELSKANFNIVARDLQGSAREGYLFGVSASNGFDINTFGLIKISGDEKPYATAVKNLWKNYQEKYGDIKGKNLVLVNVRLDNEMINTLIYTEVKYFITADVVEFTE
jgi:hypothetical protein